MKNKTQKTWLWLGIIAVALTTAPKAAQAATNGFVVPFFRGSANSEYGYWENFASLYGGINLPDQPGATTGAGLVQNNSDIFDIGNGNIYSFDIATDFTLTDSTPFTLGTVVLQTATRGSELDYNSVILTYNNGSGMQTLAPTIYSELSNVPSGGMGGANVSSLFQWDLAGLGITDYTITFAAAEPSMSFDAMTLDTWSQFAPVPEPSTLALGGFGLALFGVMTRRMKKI